jgi:transcriptional/translational regulatory protein YebC/TACO1
LAQAIVRAKKGSCQKAIIDAAIARGQGLSASGAKLETFIEGGTLSQTPSTAILIDCLTDNPNQNRIDIRGIFKRFGVTSSSTTYLFDKIGKIKLQPKEGVSFEAFWEVALDAGASEVEVDENNCFLVETEVSNITKIIEKCKEALSLEVLESEIIWKPQIESPVDDEASIQLHELIEQLEELPSVRAVYTNQPKSHVAMESY